MTGSHLHPIFFAQNLDVADELHQPTPTVGSAHDDAIERRFEIQRWLRQQWNLISIRRDEGDGCFEMADASITLRTAVSDHDRGRDATEEPLKFRLIGCDGLARRSRRAHAGERIIESAQS